MLVFSCDFRDGVNVVFIDGRIQEVASTSEGWIHPRADEGNMACPGPVGSGDLHIGADADGNCAERRAC